MNDNFQSTILKSTGASSLYKIKKIQDLWSSYGEIVRYGLRGTDRESVVVKHISFPQKARQPKGWNKGISHKRKLKSYRVEMEWYRNWSTRCDDSCRVPEFIAGEFHEDEIIIILEDLDSIGYSKRKSGVNWEGMKPCITWLANFHATYMSERPGGLWRTGTYWHLETRPDELKVLSDKPLKQAAKAIDSILRRSPFQTFVHGDAKLANFCFSPKGREVSAVDYQYVGGGCGMKDLAYFAGSCLYEDECERMESQILDFYFQNLNKALRQKQKEINFSALEKNWRKLYYFAWADFHRFMKGWAPGHWKKNSYSERIAERVIGQMNKGENPN
jgi:Ecdysteroid kinase-like family